MSRAVSDINTLHVTMAKFGYKSIARDTCISRIEYRGDFVHRANRLH